MVHFGWLVKYEMSHPFIKFVVKRFLIKIINHFWNKVINSQICINVEISLT